MSYCLNSETKSHLVEAIGSLHIVKQKHDELVSFINEMDTCTLEDAPKGKKKMRPLSKYNIFLSSCMKGNTKKSMSDCIPIWRQIKECMKSGSSLDICKSQQGY